MNKNILLCFTSLVPHEAKTDIEIHDFTVPKNSKYWLMHGLLVEIVEIGRTLMNSCLRGF